MHHSCFFGTPGCATPVSLVPQISSLTPVSFSLWIASHLFFRDSGMYPIGFVVVVLLGASHLFLWYSCIFVCVFLFCFTLILWDASYPFTCWLWPAGEGGAQFQHSECLLAQHWLQGRWDHWDTSQRAWRITPVWTQPLVVLLLLLLFFLQWLDRLIF